MGDGFARTSILAPDVSGPARWLARSADIFNVLVVFFPYCDYFVVVVICNYFKDVFGACFDALPGTLTKFTICP